MHTGLLKLRLATHGVALAPGLETRPEIAELLTLGRDPGGDPLGCDGTSIDLILPDDVLARVCLSRGPVESLFTLQADDDRYFLSDGAEMRCEVRVPTRPQFYGRRTARGLPMGEIARVYGNHIAIHPAAACGFSLRGRPCAACAGTEPEAAEREFPEVTDVVEIVRAAFDEGVAEFVYLNTSLAEGEDRGIRALEPYIKALKRHFDTFVVAQLHPPSENKWIDRTYAAGVDALSYSVETLDPDVLAKHLPGRARRIGAGRYRDALAYAATVFPNGTVWSDLAVGLEPVESTIRAIDELTEIGVSPVLGLARGSRSAQPPLSAEEAQRLGSHLYEAVKRHNINMGWLHDLGTGMTPLEARFFAGEEARMAVAVHNFYRSKLGGIAARSLARFRRRMRVRAVSDSFDASGL